MTWVTFIRIIAFHMPEQPRDLKELNREEWLTRLKDLIVEKIFPAEHQLYNDTPLRNRKVQVSCGWPVTGGLGKVRRRVGECWDGTSSQEGVFNIFISPWLEKEIEVASTLVHELVHASLSSEAKHGPLFKRLMKEVGLQGKATATEPTEELVQALWDLLDTLGSYPHSRVDSSKRKKQSTRMLKLEAVECCGYVARTTKKWLEVGLLTCPHGIEMALQNPEALEETPDE